MKPALLLLSALALIAFAPGCKKKNELSPIPLISLTGFGPDSVKFGASEDTAFLSFTFVDGDADLGNTAINTDIFLRDSRNGNVQGYSFPEFPEAVRDPEVGMTGSAIVVLYAAFLLPRDSIHAVTGDTVRYEVWVKDRAGNESNHFTTPDLYLLP